MANFVLWPVQNASECSTRSPVIFIVPVGEKTVNLVLSVQKQYIPKTKAK